jgi:hypothetical protein
MRILPHEDHVPHTVINGSLSDVGRTAEPRPSRSEHLERKMMLATARNDDLEDPEAVKALPGMRAHSQNLRPRHRLAHVPHGRRGAQKTW